MTIKKVDESAYQQGFTQAVNGGKVRDLAESIDFEDDGPETGDNMGAAPSKLIGFLDGVLQRFAAPKT